MDAPNDSGVHFLDTLPREAVRNFHALIEHEDAARKLSDMVYEVRGIRMTSRRIRVTRHQGFWRCQMDKATTDKPCSHILVVMFMEGEFELQNTSAAVHRKGDEPRNHSLEEQAFQLVPTLAPEFAARLLDASQAVLELHAPPRTGVGRPNADPRSTIYQLIVRELDSLNLRTTVGAMQLPHHANHLRGPALSKATLSRFLTREDLTPLFEKLLAISNAPARPFENVAHPDGTGLTSETFGPYFQEKHIRRGERREHDWYIAVLLWTYEYNLVASVYTHRGSVGEARLMMPLLDQAATTLNITEIGGDKAYVSYDNFRGAAERGMDAQIKLKAGLSAKYSNTNRKHLKRKLEEASLDPEGYATKANRRSNAESCNHAFKARFTATLRSKGARARYNEVLLRCIAYNLTRLIVLHLKEKGEIDFRAGVMAVTEAKWILMEQRYHDARAFKAPISKSGSPSSN